MTPTPASTPLLADIRLLIDGARQRVANAVNAELTQLYWHIGYRINAELLQGQRAEYGKQVVAELARQLTVDFGKGWSEQQLRHCMRLAEIFVDEQILSTVRRELSWSHLKTVIYDAAHAFGVKDKSGAIIRPDAKTKKCRHRQHRPVIAPIPVIASTVSVIASEARQSIPRLPVIAIAASLTLLAVTAGGSWPSAVSVARNRELAMTRKWRPRSDE